MKQFIAATHIAIAACCCCAPAAFAQDLHVTWADQLLAGITPANNNWGASPAVVTWRGVKGATTYTNNSEAASFITALLKQAYGAVWAQTHYGAKGTFGMSAQSFTAGISPGSAKYHDIIATPGNAFATRLFKVTDIQAGDLLSIKYSATTGHTMMADGPVVAHAASAPIIAGTRQWEIKVIDSASMGHEDCGDSRWLPSGVWDQGVGKGTFRLYADANDNLVGYTWSLSSTSVYYSLASARHLVIGRVK